MYNFVFIFLFWIRSLEKKVLKTFKFSDATFIPFYIKQLSTYII